MKTVSAESKSATPENDLLLEVSDLKTYFFTQRGVVRAVDGVSFEVPRNKIVGIVGESGCGKSVTGHSILGIVPPPGQVVEGSMLYYGHNREEPVDLARLGPRDRRYRKLRGKELAMILQEPRGALSPVHTVGNQIMESVRLHENVPKDAARARCLELLKDVGIPAPDRLMDAHVFELSRGLCQRVLIAMALAGRPKLLVADEPTSAIDVTIQSKLLELVKQLHTRNGMSVVLITHNMAIVAELAHEVIVMYLGTVAEKGSVKAILDDPKHPYTQALMRSLPSLDTEPKTILAAVRGTVPDPHARPPGCPFSDRCLQFMKDSCDASVPPLYAVGEGHMVSCYLHRTKP